MPFERREILFNLPEICALLAAHAKDFDPALPVDSTSRILDSLHTRDFNRQFHTIQDRFRRLYAQHGRGQGIMFRATRVTFFKKDQIEEFFVSDRDMEKLLLIACRDAKIQLPRVQKYVIAEDLCLGFQFTLDNSGLALAAE